MSSDCFRLKGSVITTFILEFSTYDSDQFEQQLKDKVNASPDFFKQSPVIIDFSQIDLSNTDIDYATVISVCRDNNLQPVAFRHSANLDINSAKDTNLAIIEHKATQSEKPKTREQQPASVSKTKLINKPVRSGQQIYTEGDLVILGSVSGGAEVLADGNIHIYGSLRGRALAGVKGDASARVFCSNNEAELVSISGHFLLNESLETQHWKQPAQFFLEQETLHVSAL